MRDTLLLLATCAIAALGFALMAFSQKQHWPRLRPSGGLQRSPAWFRPTGWVLLGLAVIPVVVRDGLAFGLLLWIGLLTFSAIPAIGLAARLGKRASRSERRSEDEPTERLGGQD